MRPRSGWGPEDGLDASDSVFRILERETRTGRVKVYLSAIPCLVKLAFDLSDVKNGKQA